MTRAKNNLSAGQLRANAQKTDKLDGGAAGFASVNGKTVANLTRLASELGQLERHTPDGLVQTAGLFAIAASLDRLTAMVETVINMAIEKDAEAEAKHEEAMAKIRGEAP